MTFGKKEYLILTVILLVSVLFRFYLLEERFPFGWDQERDAQVMWQIIKEGKLTLIGPRVVSPDSFFLGPAWYYLLVPFYFIFEMDPIASAYFASLVGIMTTLGIYLLIRYLFGFNQAIVASLIWATLPDRNSWSPMLISLAFVLIFFTLYKISQGYKKFIPLTFLLIGLSLQIHIQSIFFFPALILAIYFLNQKKSSIPLKQIIFGLILFFITFVPLIIFDLRHEFLNTKGFINLFSKPNSNIYKSELINSFIISFQQFLRSAHFTLFPRLFIFEQLSGLVITCLSFVGIFMANISRQIKWLLLISILAPPIFISFYKGDISEYYFTISAIPIIAGLSLLMEIRYRSLSGKALVIILISMLLSWRLSNFLSGKFYSDYLNSSLYHKKRAVLFIINQKIDPIFNVSYSTKVNDDAGFRYLFKFYGREPQDIPAGHLWTIVIPAYTENVPPIATFGDIGIIRR